MVTRNDGLNLFLLSFLSLVLSHLLAVPFSLFLSVSSSFFVSLLLSPHSLLFSPCEVPSLLGVFVLDSHRQGASCPSAAAAFFPPPATVAAAAVAAVAVYVQPSGLAGRGARFPPPAESGAPGKPQRCVTWPLFIASQLSGYLAT